MNRSTNRSKPTAKKKAAARKSKGAGFKFPVGNKFWMRRAKHGRNSIWSNPNDLLDDCISYFEWVEDNPLWESKAFAYRGVVTHTTLPKMRAATLCGLQIHLGISDECWRQYRERPDFVGVIEWVEMVIRDQKFSGAAAGVFNAQIIARDLGLVDKQQSDIGNQEDKPFRTENKNLNAEITPDMDEKEAYRLYRTLLHPTQD